jgi:hypothetical protein
MKITINFEEWKFLTNWLNTPPPIEKCSPSWMELNQMIFNRYLEEEKTLRERTSK